MVGSVVSLDNVVESSTVNQIKNTGTTSEAPSLQLIDEHKTFNSGLLPYIQQFYDASDEKGLNYHIVSVFGSQSTGKSTLLNRLFGTKFDVMDEAKRQQTTKGIWFSHANSIASAESETGSVPNFKNIFVLDVEGVDGREKADDKDFERKSALFALATSEILIINIWEHQVGLYQGANMELLKTVFEVNLSLFHSNKQKCLLLFVIRDFTGMTPLDNLSYSLNTDLNNVWNALNKAEGNEDLQLTDFFDLKFVSISHKHFKTESFEQDIKLLGDRFNSQDDLFRPEYHRNIPIDAWTLYSEQVWQQIEQNKDLDLPTQQILVARFRCDELSQQAFERFEEEFGTVQFNTFETSESLSNALKKLRLSGMVDYDLNASRYANSVYIERRELLLSKIDSKLKIIHSNQLDKLHKQAMLSFAEGVVAGKKSRQFTSFQDILKESTISVINEFKKEASTLEIAEAYTYEKELITLNEAIAGASEEFKAKEAASLISKTTKKFQTLFRDCVHDTLSNPASDSWDRIMDEFNKSLDTIFDKYKSGPDTFDFQLGLSSGKNAEMAVSIKKSMWIKFRDIVHDFINEDTVSRILRNKFEDDFRYGEDALPRIWKNSTEVDQQFNKAKAAALKMLPILSIAVLSSTNEEILPDVDIAHDDEFDDFEEDEYSNPHNFSHLLTNRQQNSVSNRVKKEMDAIYVETKRSIISNTTSIPFFIYIIIIVLGWNEFMAVLRNPLLFALSIVVVTGTYFAYNLQLLGPIISIAQAMAEQTKTVAKQKVKELVLDGHERVKVVDVSSSPKDNVELDDLTENGETR